MRSCNYMVKVTVYDQRVMDQRMVGRTNGPEVVVVVVVIVVVAVVVVCLRLHNLRKDDIVFRLFSHCRLLTTTD